MGLDMYLFTTAEIKNIEFVSKSKSRKNKYDREVLVTFADDTFKEIKAYTIHKLIMKSGEIISLWEIKSISPKGRISLLYWNESVKAPQEKRIHMSDIKSIDYTHAYWRKANQIHQYFVDTIQQGNDNCGEYNVKGSELFKLIDVCLEVLNRRSEKVSKKKLPTQSGFFFGSTQYDNYYYLDLEDTVKQLVDVKANQTYTYTSSW